MSFAMHAVIRRDPGVPVPVEETGPQKILSGWAGLYSATPQELRLFCVLLPGDVVTAYRGCVMQALTAVQLEPCTEAPKGYDALVRHCFRLSQYSALHRVADFLLDVHERLRDTDGVDGNSYPLPLTQEQMGELLGMSTVHINRTLKALRPLVRFEKRHIHIDDPQKLADMCRSSDRPQVNRVGIGRASRLNAFSADETRTASRSWP